MVHQSKAGASGSALNNHQQYTVPGPKTPDDFLPDCAEVSRKRQLIKQHRSMMSLNRFSQEEVHKCIAKQRWCFTNPNPWRYQDVTSPESFMDILARLYLDCGKKKDKFMPTEKRLNEYMESFETADGKYKSYAKATFEYYASPDLHGVSGKPIQGLYKRLPEKQKETFKEAQLGTNKANDCKLLGRKKTVSSQVPMTSLEDSYNIILWAHVDNTKTHIHYGRDLTYSRAREKSCSITKDVTFRFIQDCPGCAKRTGECSRARDKAVEKEKQKNRAKEEPPPAAAAEENQANEHKTNPRENAQDVQTFDHPAIKHMPNPTNQVQNMNPQPSHPVINNFHQQASSQSSSFNPVIQQGYQAHPVSDSQVAHVLLRFLDLTETEDTGSSGAFKQPTNYSEDHFPGHSQPQYIDPALLKKVSESGLQEYGEVFQPPATRVKGNPLQGRYEKQNTTPNYFKSTFITGSRKVPEKQQLEPTSFAVARAYSTEPQNQAAQIHETPNDGQSTNLEPDQDYIADIEDGHFLEYVQNLELDCFRESLGSSTLRDGLDFDTAMAGLD